MEVPTKLISAALLALESPVFGFPVKMPSFIIGIVPVSTTGTQLNYLNAVTGTTGTTNSKVALSNSPTLTGTVVIEGTSGNTQFKGHAIQMTRASANYLWATTADGYLYFGANGNALGSASALMRIGSAACYLYYGAAETDIKLATTNAGIDLYGNVASETYVSQLTGWRISHAGAADFRYIYTEELHAKSFTADLEQALAGGQIISKSVAPLAAVFTVPAASAVATLVVESFIGFDSFKVFVDGDIIRLRQFSRTGTALDITDCWGTVAWVSTDTTAKTQTYNFTRSAAPNAGAATAATTIAIGALALDYGTTGNGFLESNAIDGDMAENSPYHQIVSWAAHPATGQTVRTRLGNLNGIFSVANEFGLYAGNGILDASQYLRISDQAIEGHNLTIKLYDGAVNTVLLSPTTPSFAMGSTLPTGYLVGNGIWMGKDTVYKFRVGSVAVGALVKGISWDGTTFTVKGTVVADDGYIGGETGWAITNASLVKDTGNPNTSAGLAPNDVFYYAGKEYADRATAPFRVTTGGVLRVPLIYIATAALATEYLPFQTVAGSLQTSRIKQDAATNAIMIEGTNGGFVVPRLTTAQRGGIATTNGMVIYNTDDNEFQGYKGGSWVNI